MLKQRGTNSSVLGVKHHIEKLDGRVSYHGTTLCSYPSSWESISYSQLGKGAMNNCSHVAWTSQMLEGPLSYSYPTFTGTQHYPLACILSTLYGMHTWAMPTPPSPPGFPDFRNLAFNRMVPSMKSSLSLTNFLLELGDIKQMFRRPASLRRAWSSGYKHFTPKRIKKMRHEIVNDLHESNLNYNFGWKPFISDCKKIAKGISKFDERFAKFEKKVSGEWKKAHYFAESKPDPIIMSGPLLDYPAWQERTTWTLTNVVQTAMMTYRSVLPSYSRNEMKIRAWMDTLGLNLSPAVIWEAIPYSFVVDWFTNVGDCLKNIESSYLDPNTEIGVFVTGFKYNFDYKYEILAADSQSPSWTTVAVGKGKNYNRTVGWPPIQCLSGDLSAMYDPSRLSLASSLLYKRLT